MKKLILLSVLLPLYSCITSVAEKGFIHQVEQKFKFLAKKPESDIVMEQYEQTERKAILASQAVDSTLESKVESTANRIEFLKSKIRKLSKENEQLKYRLIDLETVSDNCNCPLNVRKSLDSISITTSHPFYGKR